MKYVYRMEQVICAYISKFLLDVCVCCWVFCMYVSCGLFFFVCVYVL